MRPPIIRALPPPIPPGVYYSADSDNFYNIADNKGMGWDFYRVWRARRSEFPTSASQKVDERLAIVFDGTAWHVRRLRVIEHDLTADEKVYRCDLPLANDLPTLDAAVNIVKLRMARR